MKTTIDTPEGRNRSELCLGGRIEVVPEGIRHGMTQRSSDIMSPSPC
ncbi:hypothetical protein ACFLSJ_08715 [Verrucomicrobiota bacterium]